MKWLTWYNKHVKEDNPKIRYLRTGEYSKKYRISKNHVRKMCDCGRLEFYRLDGGQRRVLDKPPIKRKYCKKGVPESF